MSNKYIAFSVQNIGDEEGLYEFEDVAGDIIYIYQYPLRFILSGSLTARVKLSRLPSND